MSCRHNIKSARETLRELVRDVRGVVAIEFALVMLPFALLVFGIIEVAVLYLGAISLEDAVASAGRQIRTGTVQSAGDTNAQLTAFQQIFCAEVAAVVSCNNNLTIDVRSFGSFAAVTFTPLIDEDTGELIPTTFTPGGSGTINLVRVAYSYDIMTPLLSRYLGDGSTGIKTLEASTVIRNEPF
jgi:Flp pilus assembly protein TadG